MLKPFGNFPKIHRTSTPNGPKSVLNPSKICPKSMKIWSWGVLGPFWIAGRAKDRPGTFRLAPLGKEKSIFEREGWSNACLFGNPQNRKLQQNITLHYFTSMMMEQLKNE